MVEGSIMEVRGRERMRAVEDQGREGHKGA